MTAKIYLKVVEPLDGDSTLIWDGEPGKPMFVGDEPDESLACGSCKTVVGKHISTQTMYDRFVTETRIVIRCGCGAHLLLPAGPR